MIWIIYYGIMLIGKEYQNIMQFKETSVNKDAAFCLCCYLFRDNAGKCRRNDAWTIDCFSNCNKPKNISEHVRGVNSFYNNAAMKCQNLMKEGYIKWQWLPFHGHEEKEESANNGNFLELLKYTAEQNKVVSKVVLGNAPGNNHMTSPKIHKDIVHNFAEELSTYASYKEHMAAVFQFVDKSGIVKERFISLTHVSYTSSSTLKYSIDSLFVKHELTLQKSLLSKKSTSVYYVHCFAHHLQLKDVNDGERKTGKMVKPRCFCSGPWVTSWGSHYRTLLCVIECFSSIFKVLESVQNDGQEDLKRRQAYGLRRYVNSFDFVFYLHVMVHLLGITNILSLSLQNRDQDTLNAMSLVKSTRKQLQKIRDDGGSSLMIKISYFCKKHDIQEVNCLFAILDLQLQEFDDRFNKVHTELLIWAASLSPIDSFSQFNNSKLIRLATFYPYDFSHGECISLEKQLDTYTDNIRSGDRFIHLEHLGELSRTFVETQMHMSFPLVYRLLKLILILSVATATVERSFLAMKTVKTNRQNQIGD
ncbi:hypothetical protein N665_0387s0018 [Sinapis alba]|nr:hypothetical protein N665_0387s0018 [Sinapis alba]